MSNLFPVFKSDAIDLSDRENPRSLWGLLPTDYQKHFENIKKEYLEWDESEAHKYIQPSPTLHQLKAAFWVEYNRTQTLNNPKMDMVNCYAGIVSANAFNKIVRSREMFAWIVIPPQSYQAMLVQSLVAANYILQRVLATPITDVRGQLRIQQANLVFRIWNALHEKHFGMAVQKTLHAHVEADVRNALHGKSETDLQERIRELSEKLGKVPEIEVKESE